MVMCAYAVINGEVSYLCASADGFGQYESASTITFNSKVTQEGEYVQ